MLPLILEFTAVMKRKILPKRLRGKNYYQSVSKKLLKERKITREFETRLASLTLEEIISLKLELAAKNVGGKLYGFPVWKASTLIIKDSLIKFALSATNSHREAAGLLGITIAELKRFIKKYKVNDYFLCCCSSLYRKLLLVYLTMNQRKGW